jgi:hypothetical protein
VIVLFQQLDLLNQIHDLALVLIRLNLLISKKVILLILELMHHFLKLLPPSTFDLEAGHKLEPALPKLAGNPLRSAHPGHQLLDPLASPDQVPLHSVHPLTALLQLPLHLPIQSPQLAPLPAQRLDLLGQKGRRELGPAGLVLGVLEREGQPVLLGFELG